MDLDVRRPLTAGQGWETGIGASALGDRELAQLGQKMPAFHVHELPGGGRFALGVLGHGLGRAVIPMRKERYP